MRLVWIYGFPCTGKTTVAWELYRRLDGAAFADIDQLGMCYPEADDDPGRHRLKGEALRALAGVHLERGTGTLLVPGVLDPARIDWYHEILGDRADLQFVQLVGDPAVLRRRNTARGPFAVDPTSLFDHADGLGRLAGRHPCVDTRGLTAGSVADRVLAGLKPSGTRPGNPETVADEPVPLPVLWIRGTRLSGRSTVAWSVFTRLRRAGTKSAYLDVEQLSFGPAPSGEPRFRLAADVIARLGPVLLAHGARCLVVSGDSSWAGATDLIRSTFREVSDFRLVVTRAELAVRVAARVRGQGPHLPGDDIVGLAVPEQNMVMEDALRQQFSRSGTGPSVAAGGRGPEQIAVEVLAAAGLTEGGETGPLPPHANAIPLNP